ncbi:MAG: hypothetical protein DWB42_06530 [Chloroflexi bacterium]|nr:hypothetical protein [Chloroflexota bacterium]MDL1884071.1 hypothetical protein [Anaerolineae bacterium CFX8]
MSRLLRSALALVAGLTAAILLIRARPFQAETIRAFLQAPPGCPAPCWQGIRPDVTDLDTARRLLRANPWVENLDERFHLGNSSGWLTWRWSGAQPPLNARSGYDSLGVSFNTVKSISIQTRIRFGELWLALGPPDWWKRTLDEDTLHLESAWLGESFLARLELPCRVHSAELWSATVTLLWVNGIPANGGDGPPAALPRCDF